MTSNPSPSDVDPQPQSGAAISFPSVGRWRVTALPRGWMFVANFGIRQMLADPEAVPANVALGEDVLSGEAGLVAYIGAQIKMMEQHLLLPKIAGPQPMAFAGADEGYLVFVRHIPDGGESMLHVQRYVRSGTWIGIITLTTLDAALPDVRPDYEAFVKGLRILSA